MKTQVTNPRFANGRFVRSFFEKVKKQHIMNYSKKVYSDDKKYVITLQDMEPLFTADSLEESDV